jgi:aminoglycoside phosphotransferase (APT) family kinase protein
MHDWWSDHEARRRMRPSLEGLVRMEHALGDGASVLGVRRLHGGIINSTHAVTIRHGGGTRRLVLKQFLMSPDDARREWEGLQLARRAGVAAPRPVLLADEGEWFEWAAMLVTLLPGRARVSDRPGPLPGRLGRTLAAIHAGDVRGLRPEDRERFWRPSEEPRDGLLAEVHSAVVSAYPAVPPREPVLLHCDFWTGNVLWRFRRPAGVVDWSRSCVGPRGYDVGYARADAEIAWGRDAADRLTDSYSETAGAVPDLPVWDLVCGANAMENAVWWQRGYRALGRKDVTLERIQARLGAFLRRALERI